MALQEAWRNEDDMAKEPLTELQRWMVNRGIKQSWLSEQTGYKQTLVSKWCTGKTKPDIDEARFILCALQTITPDVTLDDLWPLPKEERNE